MRRLAPGGLARAVIVAGVLLIIGTLALDMSGSAPRLAGSNGIRVEVFSTVAPGGATVCEVVGALPRGTGGAKLLIGTYNRPLPLVRIRFLDASGSAVALGDVRGGRQGYVSIPLRRRGAFSAAKRACVRIGGHFGIALGGIRAASKPVDEVIDGSPAPGLFSIYYLRADSQTWWQFLPLLDLRFGLGKAPFFSRWALPVVAGLALLVCAGAIALLWRELT